MNKGGLQGMECRIEDTFYTLELVPFGVHEILAEGGDGW